VLSAANWNLIFIPEGFAHSYCKLESDTGVIYKVSVHYSHEQHRGLLWNDPDFGISWPWWANEALVSDRDRAHPVPPRLPRYFRYEPPSNPQG
jgi:dTDP-4-dehydrorhamnose 3,5-epimerase